MEAVVDWFEEHHADDWNDPALVIAALAFAGAPPEGLETLPPPLVPAA